MELALGIFAGLVLFAAFGKPLAKFIRAISPALPGLLAKLLRLGAWVLVACIWGFVILVIQQSKFEDAERIGFVLGGAIASYVTRFLCYFVAEILDAVGEAEVARGGRGIFAESEDEEAPQDEPEEPQEEAPKKKKRAPARERAADSEGDAVFEISDKIEETDVSFTWKVDLESMTLAYRQRDPFGDVKKSYLMRRTKDGDWLAKLDASSYKILRQDLELKRDNPNRKDPFDFDGAVSELDEERDWFALEDLDAHLATLIDTRWRRYVRS
jgi:hypothetical protein